MVCWAAGVVELCVVGFDEAFLDVLGAGAGLGTLVGGAIGRFELDGILLYRHAP